MQQNFQYPWTDNPTQSGISKCDTDILNDCLMHLKYDKKDGASGLTLFDLYFSDRILSDDEALGKALLGTYVYKDSQVGREGYPDFYAKVIEQYQDENNTTETLSGVTITVNSNGHKFYDIADKAAIDAIYNSTGIAWYYGVDIENERVFLPRNNKYFGLTSKSDEIGTMGEAGAPNFKGDISAWGATLTGTGDIKSDGSTSVSVSSSYSPGTVTIDLSNASSVYKNSAETIDVDHIKLYCYMIVGNTTQTKAIGEVREITTSENDTLPLFFGAYFDYKPNNASWVLSGGQVNSGSVYSFAYNELVKELTEAKYGLKVIETTDMVEGVDYSEYWKINQNEGYFVCPTKISYTPINADSVPVIGNDMALGLTDGTKTAGLSQWNPQYGDALVGFVNGYGKSVGASANQSSGNLTNGKGVGLTTDPEKSGIIADLSAAKSSTARLYFKVANAVENLELLDAGEVLEAVNDIIPDNSSLIASYAMPSGKYIDLELGADGSKYTAPSNGYFVLVKKSSAVNQHAYMQTTGQIALKVVSNTASGNVGLFVPVKKGDNMTLNYTLGGDTNRFRFVYSLGSESEAN